MENDRLAPKHGNASSHRDWMGLARLGAQGVVGVSGVVEAMHVAVASPLSPWGRVAPGRQMWGIAGLVYKAVRGVAHGLNRVALAVTPELDASDDVGTLRRNALVSALNGACGDHLAATGNPLAIRMALSSQHHAPTSRIVVLVHGLGMNPEQWLREGHDHGEALANDLGFTPVYLRYNTGLSVATNGREFARCLDTLVANWPVAVDQLVIIAHSMGGLVARSACAHGEAAHWRKNLTHLICLGTPHHGAPLERGGHWVDTALGLSPYLEPFARIGKFRSAGITDLRFGNVVEVNGATIAKPRPRSISRCEVPLPSGVRTLMVAATTGSSLNGLQAAWLGDGLVPLASALGDHPDARFALSVPLEDRLVVTQANHWDLLSRSDVYAALRHWLS
jgi:pimeloyl-ACP methyl ester carboxylesterase